MILVHATCMHINCSYKKQIAAATGISIFQGIYAWRHVSVKTTIGSEPKQRELHLHLHALFGVLSFKGLISVGVRR